MATCIHGMAAYIKKLEEIAEQCGEKKAKDPDPKDDFLRTKIRMYGLLSDIRECIHERQAVLKKRGNCHETIQKGHQIRQQLDELKRSLPLLQKLHKQAQSKRNAGQRKEELQARYQDIRVLKRQVDEVQELFISANTGMDLGDPSSAAGGPLGNPAATLFGLRDTARGDPDSRRLLNSEEQEALSKMRARDAEVDQQVAEIGDVVDRMNPLARQIGVTAEQQKSKADKLTDDVDKNVHEIEEMNKKIKEVLRYEKNTTCCCQMILGIVLLCIIGFICHQLGLGG